MVANRTNDRTFGPRFFRLRSRFFRLRSSVLGFYAHPYPETFTPNSRLALNPCRCRRPQARGGRICSSQLQPSTAAFILGAVDPSLFVYVCSVVPVVCRGSAGVRYMHAHTPVQEVEEPGLAERKSTVTPMFFSP